MEEKGHRDGIRVEVERVSRFLLVHTMPRIASPETAGLQLQLLRTLPPDARKSTTLDYGRKHHAHTWLQFLGVGTYFADPYSPWQRGTCASTFGLLRRYLPKGTDLSTVPDDELQDIIAEINHRPRKCLGFKTPAEVFSSHLGSAIQSRM